VAIEEAFIYYRIFFLTEITLICTVLSVIDCEHSTGMRRKIDIIAGLAVVLAAIQIGGCAATSQRGDVAASGGGTQVQPDCLASADYASPSDEELNYKIQSGDDLIISFYLNSEFDSEVTVRPDGKISLRLVGEQDARGLTPKQLSGELDKAYSRELLQPGVSVTVKNSPSRVVFVQGQVSHPGAVPLQPEMTALGAISQAGGLTDDANSEQVLLIRRDQCGQAHGQELKINLVLAQKSDIDNTEDARLLPGDVLVVPRTTISNVGLFVKHYVKDLIPIQPYLPIL
jgi:protein involved in polysaccharide export with SLBB domain